MTTIGIDIGGKQHAVAPCRGQPKADREVLRVSQNRAGFDRLDAWLERQAGPVELVTMESSGHYWMSLASHLQGRGVAVAVVKGASHRPDRTSSYRAGSWQGTSQRLRLERASQG